MAFGLNKEIERRFNELIRLNKIEGKGTLRISGGWRSDARIYSEFFRRYTYVGVNKPSGNYESGHLKYFPGDDFHLAGWYVLNDGEIPSATPGNSYHGTMPPDALTGDTGAVAADMVNELDYFQANAHRVGIRASKVPGEKHHGDPLEYPAAKRNFNPATHKLTVWELVSDMNKMVIIKVPGDRAEWLRDGIFVTHVANGNIRDRYIKYEWVELLVKLVEREDLLSLFGRGNFPTYTPSISEPNITKITDFAGWDL